VLLVGGVTAGGSLLLGLPLGASVGRSISLGFYAVGCFLMVSGFFVGNRGPARVASEGHSLITPFSMFGVRGKMRWASLREQNENINYSAFFVIFGLVLVVAGIVLDPRHSLL